MELCRADWVLKLRGNTEQERERDREMRGLEVSRRENEGEKQRG